MPVETVTLVSADGTTIPLDGTQGYTISDGGTGRFAPTFNLITEQLPNDGGTRLRNVVPQPRTIVLPLRIDSTTAASTRNLWRALVAMLDPRLGDARLQFTGPDATTREFRVRYSAGLEGDDSTSKADPGLLSWETQLQLVSFDPMAQDASDTQYTWTTASGGTDFFPIFPLRLGSSSIFADTTIRVAGDDLAWPVWQISGPGSELILTNVTMGRTLAWGGALGVGEGLTIDTRPGTLSADPKSVRAATGTSRFVDLTAWDMWPFTPGLQRVHIEFTGATALSQVTASYRQRWLST